MESCELLENVKSYCAWFHLNKILFENLDIINFFTVYEHCFSSSKIRTVPYIVTSYERKSITSNLSKIEYHVVKQTKTYGQHKHGFCPKLFKYHKNSSYIFITYFLTGKPIIYSFQDSTTRNSIFPYKSQSFKHF